MSSRNSAISGVGEVAPVDAVARGALEQRVVDVGDVLARSAPVWPASRSARPSRSNVDVGGRVAQVRGVVGRDAADVERDELGRAQREPARRMPCRGRAVGSLAGHGGDERRRARLHRADSTVRPALVRGHTGRWPTAHTAYSGGQGTTASRAAGRRVHTALDELGDPHRERHVGPGSSARRRSRRAGSEGVGEALEAHEVGVHDGSPAQPHSTVRSFGSAQKLTPWSMPQSRPSPSRRQCEPLRSELLSAASSTASERTRRRRECTTVTASRRASRRRRRHASPQACVPRARGRRRRRRPRARTGHRSTAAPTRARAGRRASRSAARRPSRRARRPRGPPPRGRQGCRRGSPRAAARRAPACR